MSAVDTEVTVADLTPVQASPGAAGLVQPVADLEHIASAFQAYTACCDRLLTPDDYQTVGRKTFRKKSGWRKLAVAFGCSLEIRDRTYERDSSNRILRAEVVTRATAPNGRTMDGLGACDVTERCCPKAYGQACSQTGYHRHCDEGCTGFVHFSKPSHDIPATAMTRATNRAFADLFGMGEVSAEEVTTGGEHHDPPPAPVPHGFDSHEQAAEAHARVRERAKALPDDFDRSDFEEHRRAYGWPMPRAALEEFEAMLDKAEGKPESGPPAPTQPETPAGPATGQPAPDPGESGALTGTVLPPGDDVEEQARVAAAVKAGHAKLCGWCDEPLATIGEVRIGLHDSPDRPCRRAAAGDADAAAYVRPAVHAAGTEHREVDPQ